MCLDLFSGPHLWGTVGKIQGIQVGTIELLIYFVFNKLSVYARFDTWMTFCV